MTAPKEILDLVERFERNREAYRSAQYNETQLRREFLDPFFCALGWDVDNKQGHAEAYKDVIHEDAIKIGGFTKAPDYSFRIGGTRKFFVEAKKPAVDINQDAAPAFQIRRYAWSAKLPLSILINFEEFSVYDCRIKPASTDKASTGRIKHIPFAEYPEKWEEIASVFSKEAVLKGSFDKYAEASKGKKGTAEVDAAFLNDIETWRVLLATNLAVRNTGLTQRELNFAVQRTIDRIIFLRICEDRGIEPDARLLGITNGAGIYARLLELYRKADERYNSGLFHFREEKGRAEDVDRLTPGLAIDDKVLKEIIKNLYPPDSPYEFSVLPADILGQVYEQFLGKVIRLTAGHQAKVEDKPEVKKAGGVFYTPTYIVEYIVRNTVGRLLEGKSPGDAARLKIIDPACGSGSFLIGAYQRLLDWHRDWYVNNGKEKWTKGKEPALYQGPGGEWRLTTNKRKEILLNSIYGVDIDTQAVEVTKLSLLLKVLEGESDQSIKSQFILFHQRALPDLGNNIKCGNSLIGSDFYRDQQLNFFDEEERLRINVFDWEKEFPNIFSGPNPGFDAVIGNPPYVRQEGLGEAKVYFKSHYKTFCPTADLYVSFIEKGLGLLNKIGLFGMIVSNKWLRAAYGRPLREFLAQDVSVREIVDLAGLPVFSNATVRTVVLTCSPYRGKKEATRYLAPPRLEDFRTIRNGNDLQDLVNLHSMEIPVSGLSPEGWTLSGLDTQRILSGIKKSCVDLNTYIGSKPFFGLKTGFNQAFIIDKVNRDRLIALDPKGAAIIKPLIVGKDIRRYDIQFKDRYLIRSHIGVPIEKFPAIFEHLKQFQPQLQKRWDKGNHWWELRACDYYDNFEKPKIIYPDISTTCRFTLDREGYFSSNTTYFLPSDDMYLLGILNSKVGQFYFSEVCAGLEGSGSTYLRFFGQYLEKFPVHPVNFSDPADKARHDRMVQQVEQMLLLHKQLSSTKTDHEKTALQRQIDATDCQIDQLVYELYGLTDEEIQTVEEATRRAV